MRSHFSRNFICVAVVGLVGFMSLFSRTEEPQEAVKRFAKLFIAQDAAAIAKIIHPEIQADKEIRVDEITGLLKRLRSSSMSLSSFTIDKRFKSEDQKAERFQATLRFQGPRLSKDYPAPCTLNIVLVWLLENGTWFLERPLSIRFLVRSNEAYPTQAQRETALRFETAAKILMDLGLPGGEDLPLIGRTTQGPATSEYERLEKLHAKERGSKGVHSSAEGVQVLLRAADRRPGGLLSRYHGDFTNDPADTRRPVPWDMFRDYVTAAVEYGKILEKRKNWKGAEKVYRRLISLGRQFLDEPGGYQFLLWGLTYQKQGAQELVRVLPARRSAEREAVAGFIRLVSRRIDLLQTALNCLDDLADYNCLQASILAAKGAASPAFVPWGINNLSILSLKGAPANRDTLEAAGSMVLVMNPVMRKKASEVLKTLSMRSSEEVRSFVERQKRWVQRHRVYGAVQSFR